MSDRQIICECSIRRHAESLLFRKVKSWHWRKRSRKSIRSSFTRWCIVLGFFYYWSISNCERMCKNWHAYGMNNGKVNDGSQTNIKSNRNGNYHVDSVENIPLVVVVVAIVDLFWWRNHQEKLLSKIIIQWVLEYMCQLEPVLNSFCWCIFVYMEQNDVR